MVTLVACAACGVEFGLPVGLEKQRRRDHRTFHCPNGHQQFFPGKTDEEEKIERLEREVRMLEQEQRILYANREELIGVVKECPVPGCQWHSRKQIPRDSMAMGRGIERVRADLFEHLVSGHAGRVPEARQLEAGAPA